jgi:CelD/BcsL family acetyltransferase involved in cellulose biosynthesis
MNGDSQASFRVERLSPEAFDTLERPWESLLQHSDKPTVFTTWAYLRTWWRFFGASAPIHSKTNGESRELLLLGAYQGDQMVGIAPLYLTQSETAASEVRFLGFGSLVNPDYLDFIVDRRVGSARVRHAFLEFLRKHDYSSRLLLTDVASHAEMEAALRSSQRLSYVREGAAVCSYAELPKTWQEFNARLSSNTRYNLSRRLRALTAPGVTQFRKAQSDEEVSSILHALREMHAARWRAVKLPSRYTDDTYFAFHCEVARELLRRDRLRLYALSHADEPIAILYCYRYDRTIYYYSGSFDSSSEYSRYSPGNVLRALAIKDAIESGCVEFDFLRGDDDYKAQWCNARRFTYSYYVVAPGVRGRWANRDVYARSAKRRVKAALRERGWMTRH